MSPSSFVGEMSISSTRSLPAGPIGSGIEWSTSSFIRPETKRTVPIACE